MTNAMTNTLNNTNTAMTMSSREIAELTGKRHDNVKRTIETLISSDVISTPQIEEYTNSINRTASEYLIGKRDSYVIVAQLSPEFTAKLVDRWHELEEQVAATPKLPTNFAEALRLAVKLEEQVDTLRIQNEAMRPAAKVGAAVAKLSDQTVTEFVCQLPGVNIMRVQSCLSELGYLKRNSRRQWMVCASYRDKLFAIATRAAKGPFTFPCVVVLQKGREKLIDLYMAGQLPMKKGFTPDQSIGLQN